MDFLEEVEKRTQVFEMRCYRKLLNFLSKDHVTNKEARRKIQAAIGEYDEILTVAIIRTPMVWPYLKSIWFSKDSPTGHSKRKEKKR